MLETHLQNRPPDCADACYGCGLHKPQDSCTLSYPSELERFDFSSRAVRIANNVIQEGAKKLFDLEKAVQRLHHWKQQINDVIARSRALLADPPIHRLPDVVLALIFARPTGHNDKEKDEPWEESVVCRR